MKELPDEKGLSHTPAPIDYYELRLFRIEA
jgi:hypothetical protein